MKWAKNMTKQQRLTYKEDGITFEIIKKTRDKTIAQAEALIWRKEYYSRVKHFYKSDGSIDFYGVIKSLKPKKETTIKKSYKPTKREFSQNIDDRIIEMKKDFLLAKKRLPKVFEDYFRRDMNERIITVKLKFNNSNEYYYRRSDNTVNMGIKFLKFTPRNISRLIIVHELLHTDLHHNSKSRSYGYYSSVSTKDKLSIEIMKRVGFTPPTDYGIKIYENEMLKKGYKEIYKGSSYVIYCPKCDISSYRSRKSKAITNIEKYKCGKCKGKLEVEKL